MKKLILLAALAVASPVVQAEEVRGISCDGCSSSHRYQQAVRALDSGTVYVFNANNGRVHKYKVITEKVDSYPYTQWTEAVEVKAEWRVRNAYRNFIESSEDLFEAGYIQLPDDFAVRSVAGALMDPGYASTLIEDYLLQQSIYQQLQNDLSTLALRVLKAKIPLFDIQLLVDDLILTIKFPDGSTLDFEGKVTVNSLSLDAKMELEAYGNARLPNGNPAPSSVTGFRNLVINDDSGSLWEWLEYARHLGIRIAGQPTGATGTTMKCEVTGSVIVCTVTLRQD